MILYHNIDISAYHFLYHNRMDIVFLKGWMKHKAIEFYLCIDRTHGYHQILASFHLWIVVFHKYHTIVCLSMIRCNFSTTILKCSKYNSIKSLRVHEYPCIISGSLKIMSLHCGSSFRIDF